MATPSGEAPATSPDVSFTTALGKLDKFNPEESSLSAYLERVHVFFVANSIPESKQVPVFSKCYWSHSVLRDLLAPETPISQSFTDIVDALKRHFEPKSLVVANVIIFISGTNALAKRSHST